MASAVEGQEQQAQTQQANQDTGNRMAQETACPTWNGPQVPGTVLVRVRIISICTVHSFVVAADVAVVAVVHQTLENGWDNDC